MTDLTPKVPPRARPIRAAVAAAALLLLGACAGGGPLDLSALGVFEGRAMPRTQPLAAAPAPVPRPALPLASGFTAQDLLGGRPLRFDVRRTGTGRVRVTQSDGCIWTRAGDWFAPSAEWAHCDDSRHWHSGRAQVRQIASIWPLRPGAEGRWTRRAVSHTGHSYTRETVCRVTGAEAVLREGRAPTPAHVVTCRDGKRTRTTWFAAGEGPVAFRKVHDENGVEEAWVRR